MSVAEWDRIIRAGQRLSNIAYNLSQTVPDQRDRRYLKDAYEEWDAAVRAPHRQEAR